MREEGKKKNRKKIVLIIILLLLLLLPLSCTMLKKEDSRDHSDHYMNHKLDEDTDFLEDDLIEDIEDNPSMDDEIVKVEAANGVQGDKYSLRGYSHDYKVSSAVNNNLNSSGNQTVPDSNKPVSGKELVIDVHYSNTALTYRSVVVTISTNKELYPVNGWVLSEDKKSLTKEYFENIKEEISVRDRDDVTKKVVININNISVKEKEKIGSDGEFKYIVLDSGKIQIIEYLGSKIDLVIPNQYEGYQVYAVGNADINPNNRVESYNIFGSSSISNTSIKSLKFEEGLEAIEAGAFNGCSGLTGNLVIPNSITKIGNNAFSNCSNLDGTLTLSDSLKELGAGAFYQNSKLTGDLIIPGGIEEISTAAFYNCIGLNGILRLPETLKSIGKTAFYKCSNLHGDLIIPDHVEFIGGWAFQHCSGFKGNLVLSKDLVTIDQYAFDHCTGLTGQLNIPNKVERIGDWSFGYCRGLSGNLSIPDGVVEIGKYAFCSCTGFKGNLVLPSTIKTINEGTFGLCSGFSGDLIIPEGVLDIGLYAFRDCKGFNGNLVLPSTLKVIGVGAFNNCRKIIGDLIIPEGVTTIRNSAFQECYGFNGKLVLPKTLEAIGSFAFNHCQGLNITSLTIPKNMKILSEEDATTHTFYNVATRTLKEFKVEDGNQYFSTIDGVLYNKAKTRLMSYPASKLGNTFVIPEGVTDLNQMAFSRAGSSYSSVENTGLKRIVLPNSYVISTDIPSSYTVTYGNTLSNAIYVFTGVEAVDVKEDNNNYKSVDGVVYSKDGTTLWYVPVAKKGIVTIEEGVTTIVSGALESSTTKTYDKTHRSLSKIIIPKTVTYIAERELLELKSLGKNKVEFESGCIYQFDTNGNIVKGN